MIENSIKNKIENFIGNRSVLILGFGKEGRSTYKFLRGLFPDSLLTIADYNTDIQNDDLLFNDGNCNLILGENYLTRIQNFEIVFKSPGVSLKNYVVPINQYISSQTDLFLFLFSSQTIGVTGTKGKSTTASLLKHVLAGFNKKVLLIGNIGLPVLDVVNEMQNDTIAVFEMSSHQLEFVAHSPYIAVLLNLYQEHLDHYLDYKSYRFAKWNIVKYQKKSDYYLCNSDEKQVSEDIDIQDIESIQLKYGFNKNNDCSWDVEKEIMKLNSKKLDFNKNNFALLGDHNLYNAMAVVLVCDILKLPLDKVISLLSTFKGLAHRLEFVAEVNGIRFYNDSISTIPQASIRALNSVDNVSSIILGGFDRGIDYSVLIDYLIEKEPMNIILLGQLGVKLNKILSLAKYKGDIHLLDSLEDAVNIAFDITAKGSSCLLSPAASSYDSFKNFEERGDLFKALVLNR